MISLPSFTTQLLSETPALAQHKNISTTHFSYTRNTTSNNYNHNHNTARKLPQLATTRITPLNSTIAHTQTMHAGHRAGNTQHTTTSCTPRDTSLYTLQMQHHAQATPHYPTLAPHLTTFRVHDYCQGVFAFRRPFVEIDLTH